MSWVPGYPRAYTFRKRYNTRQVFMTTSGYTSALAKVGIAVHTMLYAHRCDTYKLELVNTSLQYTKSIFFVLGHSSTRSLLGNVSVHVYGIKCVKLIAV